MMRLQKIGAVRVRQLTNKLRESSVVRMGTIRLLAA